jgi:murein L,D-transpeptidase YcbB/YkuD
MAAILAIACAVGLADEVSGRQPAPQDSGSQPAPRDIVAAQILALVRTPPAPPGTVAALTAEYYERRGYDAAWLGLEERGAAVQLLQLAGTAAEDGLCSAPVRGLIARARAGPPSGTAAAALDVEITRTILSYLIQLGLGRDAAADRAASRRSIDIVGGLDAVRHAPTAAMLQNTFAPRHHEYRRLREALAVYRAIAQHGEWPQQLEGILLRPGDPAPAEAIRRLRTRLVATGDLDQRAMTNGRYSVALIDAVRRFQRRHGLLVDGVVGPDTIRAMNVPPYRRAQQIAANMDRWRQLPDVLGERHVRVNIPAFRLAVIDGDRETLAMNVVVGKRSSQTPVLSDRIQYLQFQPYWNVPDSIARNELWPRIEADPHWLESRGYEVLAGWSEDAVTIGVDAIDWEAERFHYRIRQRPGPTNALGLVKFMFPNRYHVYLHDTPAKQLFLRRQRAFSHGCVRVHDPVALATELLRDQGWTADRVRTAMRDDPRQALRLASPVPVHLLYMTSWADATGVIHFRSDVYGRDDAAIARVECEMTDRDG